MNIKAVLSDVIRAGSAVAAVLVIVLNAAGSLHVPASDVLYISVFAGIVNAVIGLLKPYASNLVAAAKGTASKK